MKIAYFDLIAGASGDMLLGALVDAGLPFADLQQALAELRLPGFELHLRQGHAWRVCGHQGGGAHG